MPKKFMTARSKKAVDIVSLSRLQKILCPVTTAGARLANIAFNAKQRDDVPEDIRKALEEQQREWDEAIKQVPKRWRI